MSHPIASAAGQLFGAIYVTNLNGLKNVSDNANYIGNGIANFVFKNLPGVNSSVDSAGSNVLQAFGQNAAEAINRFANPGVKQVLGLHTHPVAQFVHQTSETVASHAQSSPLLAGTLAALGIGAAALGGAALAINTNKTTTVKTVATELAEDAMRSKPFVDAVKAPVVMSTLKSAAMKI